MKVALRRNVNLGKTALSRKLEALITATLPVMEYSDLNLSNGSNSSELTRNSREFNPPNPAIDMVRLWKGSSSELPLRLHHSGDGALMVGDSEVDPDCT